MLVCRAHDRRRGELRDRDVIRVPVGAEWIERDDHLRPDASNVAGDFFARLCPIDAIQLAIEVIQQAHFAHAKLACRRAQLGLACLPDDGRPRRRAFVVEPPALAASRRHDERLDAFSRILRENPARPERLIVGMSEHAHQPKHHSPQF